MGLGLGLVFGAALTAAKAQGERIFTELLEAHRARLQEERERADYAFEARQQAIGRIGLPAVREHRRKRLQQEHDARLAALAEAAASVAMRRQDGRETPPQRKVA